MKQGPLQAEGLESRVTGGFPNSSVRLMWLSRRPVIIGPATSMYRSSGEVQLKAIAPQDALGEVLLSVEYRPPIRASSVMKLTLAVAGVLVFIVMLRFGMSSLGSAAILLAILLGLTLGIAGLVFLLLSLLYGRVAAGRDRANSILAALAQWTDRGSMPDYGGKAPDARDWRS